MAMVSRFVRVRFGSRGASWFWCCETQGEGEKKMLGLRWSASYGNWGNLVYVSSDDANADLTPSTPRPERPTDEYIARAYDRFAEHKDKRKADLAKGREIAKRLAKGEKIMISVEIRGYDHQRTPPNYTEQRIYDVKAVRGARLVVIANYGTSWVGVDRATVL